MWYFIINDQKYGPLQENEVDMMLKDGKLKPSTLVWQEGMTDWVPLKQTKLNALMVVNPQRLSKLEPVAPINVGYQIPAGKAAKEIKDLYKWMWICLIGGAVLSIVYIGVLGLIAGMVLYYMLLHRFWSVIQDGHARTTPGKAVGYSFIPFYNFYWAFVAYHGLAKDMNAYIDRYGIPIKKVNEGVAQWICILILVSIIPYVNFVSGIAQFILFIIFYNELKKASVMIVERRITGTI